MFFTVFLAVLFGAVCMLLLQLFLVFLYFRSRPVEPTPHPHQYERAQMDQTAKLHQKESCLCLNALIAFLFREMKDTPMVRRWVVKKMNVEFDELLTTKTAGRILEQINVRDYCLGATFPTIQNVTLMRGAPPEPGTVPEEVDIAVDLDYTGGFRISVDVDLVFGTTAFVSVCLTKLKGRARLEFTRIPYTHWSFSFYDDPEIDFKVESHFEGRTVPQLGSLIVNQLRKTLKKKHTLPSYKLRYMPFFPKPEPPHKESDVYIHDVKITVGRLNVTVVECSRLPLTTAKTHNELYCTLSVDKLPWKQEDIVRRLPGELFDVEVNREKSKSVGVTFKTGGHDGEVVVASVTADSPAGQTELKKGDIVLSVDGIRVNTTKHAAKLVKQTKEKFTLKVQRPIQQLEYHPAADDKKDLPAEKPPDNDYEDFINVSILTELGYATDDNDGTLKSAQDRLQVPDGGSPVLRHRRRLSSSLDYSTLRQVTASTDREDRLNHIKALIRESMQPKSAMKKSRSINIVTQQLSCTPTTSSDMIHIPHDYSLIEPDSISISSVASLLDETESVVQSTTSIPLNTTEGTTPYDNMYETTLVSAGPEPSWDDTFTFDLKDSDKYLNVCVWHREQSQLGEKDILLGYCCVPLVDVALQCLTTLSGEHLELFKLHPPEKRAGASRHLGNSHLYRMPGFEERLSHGDISIFFQHTPSGEQRLSKDEIAAQESVLNDQKAKHKAAEERRKAKRRAHRPEELNILPGRLHRFVGTQFSAQTKCDFCSKKIWTKYALQCQICMLICHKKCSEKTQAHITCDRNKIWHKPDQPTPVKVGDVGTSPQATPTTQRKSPHGSPYPSPTPSPNESSSQSSDDEDDDIDVMVRKLNRLKRQLKQLARAEGNKVDDTDAVFMTAAREMGRELYMELAPNARKQKLETMVNKLQKEIDLEADRQLRLAQDVQEAKRPREKAAFEDRLTRSEERMQTLAMMMLHYCAGIQHVNETSQSTQGETDSVTIPQKAQANGH